ncbi:methyltransferase, FxLD system [Streptomyces mutabilis]|uniref:methyltransferase, FxLD system n=1 Tax=Streptomyces mutabilis TaxID=67332 RepID=UPI0036792991
MTTPPITTDLDEAAPLRHQLADHLAAAGHIRTPAVDHAMRTVPRHAFAPEVSLEAAYANDIVATRHAPDGQVISSISAPWLQADMLEAAGIQPGHHALEIGSGGYNAALIAELVGPTGRVTTVDIDPAVTERATRFLAETGYDGVRVVTADAEHLPERLVPDGGFDTIVVTVDTWDLPWIGALAEGGRLIAPLRLHGYHWAIGFTKVKGALLSDEPLIVCGFVAMQGDGAWNTNRRTVPGTGVHLSWEDGTPLPVDQLAPALNREPAVTRTSITVGRQEPFDALMLYLAGALPGFCRLEVDPDVNSGVLNPPPRHWPGAAIVRGASLARLTMSASATETTARAGTSSLFTATATKDTSPRRKWPIRWSTGSATTAAPAAPVSPSTRQPAVPRRTRTTNRTCSPRSTPSSPWTGRSSPAAPGAAAPDEQRYLPLSLAGPR